MSYQLRFNDLTLDTRRLTVRRLGAAREVDLTPDQAVLLAALIEKGGETLGVGEARRRFRWKRKALAMHVMRLRRRIGSPSHITAVRGAGYAMKEGAA